MSDDDLTRYTESGKPTFTRPQLRDGKLFPDSLMIVPQRTDIPKAGRQHYEAHNIAILQWRKRNVGAMNGSRYDEYRTLDFMLAVEQYLHPDRMDPWSAEYVIEPWLTGFTNHLNHDLGRLDGGTLSEWVSVIQDRVTDATGYEFPQ